MGSTGRHWRWAAAAAVTSALLGAAAPAHADVTAFVGLSPSPTSRIARGVSAGMGLVVVAFEFEAAQTSADIGQATPALTTGSVNVLLQTPIEISRLRFYATTGGTVYRESLDDPRDPRRETHVGANVGGGLKMRVAGPLMLRVDYRLFRLRGTPLQPTAHRFYAGATLGL